MSGELIALLVDSGASKTVVDLTWCRERKIPLVDTGRKGGGAGGAYLSIYALDGVVITLDGLHLQVANLFAFDLSHVNEGLKR